MLIVFVVIGVLGVAIIGTLVYIARTQQSSAANIGERLEQFTESTMTLEELELQQPFYQRVVVPIGQSILAKLGKFGPKQGAEKARLDLQKAGNPGNITPTMFVGLRMGLSVALFVLFGIVTFSSMDEPVKALMYTLVGGAMGYVLPGVWLGQQIKKRQTEITKALPDALDLLTISVEAGLGFDVALQRVTEKWDDALSKEFKRALADMRLGRSRSEALRDMSDRAGVDDVKTFVSAIIQADQLGVSMAKILKLQSEQMRMKRRQRAEQEAQQAPIKMLFPMVFLIFPALFVVILGPAVPKLIIGLGSVSE
jgi:tight adherence protein C